MEYTDILYEVDQGRARLTLNRPERHNAISDRLLEQFSHALWEADDDRSVHCVIVRGAGKSFCSGYDLSGAGSNRPQDDVPRRDGSTIDDDAWLIERRTRHLCPLLEIHKPSIAQIHGHCLAGGTDIALFCDMLIAADDAVIGFPPARNLGSLPNNMWLYHCGPQWAKRLQLTGDTVSGAEAARIGLVMKSVPGELLEAEVEGLADRMALIDPDLLAANKRIINIGLELMGAQTLQRLAGENDTRAHRAPGTQTYYQAAREKGIREAIRERDAAFGDGRARVEGPEIRDERGRLVEP